MTHEYSVYTSINRDFDPKVEGATLDSIIESCKGYVSHALPICRAETRINIVLSEELDPKYLIEQLNSKFAPKDGSSVVLDIHKK